jgi:hypothetical protein
MTDLWAIGFIVLMLVGVMSIMRYKEKRCDH